MNFKNENIRNNNQLKKNPHTPPVSNRDLLLILLFTILCILFLTSFLNWINVVVVTNKLIETSASLSNKNLTSDQMMAVREKLRSLDIKQSNTLKFPRGFFIFILLMEMLIIAQITREFTFMPKESSIEEHEKFKIKALLVILPTSFINVLYLFLRFYLFQSAFSRVIFFLAAGGMITFAALVIFKDFFISNFLPSKAATLDEFEKLSKEFEDSDRFKR